MSVVLAGLGRVEPVATTSPLVELGSALHVLNEPAHHDAREWASEVRGAMSADLAGRTERWAWTTQAIRATPFVRPCGAEFVDELASLRTAPADEVARGLLRPVSPHGDAEAARRWARSRTASVATQVDDLIDNPTRAAAEFADFLERSWHEWFGPLWRDVRARLAAHRRRFSDRVARWGAAAAVASLDPAITAEGPDAVSIAKVQSRRHDLAVRGLYCAPSTYIGPHVYVADVPGMPLVLIHSVTDDDVGSTPTVGELMGRLDAAANPGRLEVARAIATEPRTAGEIAALWDIDATLVNRHLRTLAAAGLAHTTRQGRYVRYSLDERAVADLGHELIALLLR